MMTETEKLIHEVGALRETISRELFNIRVDSLTRNERAVIREHIERCHAELTILLDRLWDVSDEEAK